MALVITFTPDQIPEEDLIRCSDCKTQIAFIDDHLEIVQNGRTGVFDGVFNVQLLDSENYLRQVNGNTVADVYCARCGMLLGLKLIAVPRPSLDISEGRFLMKLRKLVYWNDVPMLFQEVNDEQDGNIDIDQLLNELNESANDEQVPNEQDGGANVEQVPNEQDGLANVEQVPDPDDQDGGSNEQVADEHDCGANIENAPNEQVADKHDGGANIEQVPNEQD